MSLPDAFFERSNSVLLTFNSCFSQTFVEILFFLLENISIKYARFSQKNAKFYKLGEQNVEILSLK